MHTLASQLQSVNVVYARFQAFDKGNYFQNVAYIWWNAFNNVRDREI